MKGLLISCGLGAIGYWFARTRSSHGGVVTDVTDEAVIDASPEAVYRAIVDVHNGTTQWWAPHYSMELLRGSSYDQVGARVANTVRVHGRFPIRFTTETIDVEPGRSIIVKYVGGAFRGRATWGFEPLGHETRLSNRWHTRPVGALRVLAPAEPDKAIHR